MDILIKAVSKKYRSSQALHPVTSEIKSGKVTAVLGPSGSGKTTFLKLIAGLEIPDTGRIYFGNKDVTNLSSKEREIGVVFQDFRLFLNMTARENIAFGLKLRRVRRAEIRQRVDELLQLTELSKYSNLYPRQLSGGQQQRVALARALAIQPQLLLLDEPFGALDPLVRKDLRKWLSCRPEGMTVVLVTHDREEAMEVADEVMVMRHGELIQQGTPAEIYECPNNEFVMEFIGGVNMLSSDNVLVRTGRIEAMHLKIYVRPHDIKVFGSSNGKTAAAQVLNIYHLGSVIQAELSLDGQVLTAQLTHEDQEELNLQRGQEVFVALKKVKSFPAESLLTHGPAFPEAAGKARASAQSEYVFLAQKP